MDPRQMQGNSFIFCRAVCGAYDGRKFALLTIGALAAQAMVAMDEYGRPFIILRDQANKVRITGLEAQKANIMAARSVANTLRTSLGPKGMDKVLFSPDSAITVTNDGATILKEMDVEHQVPFELGQAKSQELNVMFMETSAKSGGNIQSLFRRISASLPGMDESALATEKRITLPAVEGGYQASAPRGQEQNPGQPRCAC